MPRTATDIAAARGPAGRGTRGIARPTALVMRGIVQGVCWSDTVLSTVTAEPARWVEAVHAASVPSVQQRRRTGHG